MRIFNILLILLAMPLTLWGQQYCNDFNRELHADMGHYVGGDSVVKVPRQIYNIANTHYIIDGQEKRRVVLRLALQNVNHNKNLHKCYIRFEMNLKGTSSIIPAKKDGDGHQYPEGWNTHKWRHSIANDPSGPDSNLAPVRPNRTAISGTPHGLIRPTGYPEFSHWKDGIYTIGARYAELGNNKPLDSPYNNSNNGNPVAIAFEIVKDETYQKGIRIPLYHENHYEPNLRTVRSCGTPHLTKEYNRIEFTIDRIRPTFDNMPEVTTKVDEELFPIEIPAKDTDETGATIPQNFANNVTQPQNHEDLEDGVFINLISVKKIVNLAGGGVFPKKLITDSQKGCI